MSVISQRVPSLIGGVSQQPDTLKLPNQLRSCDDFYPDPTFGLAKRPGFKAIKSLSGAAAEGSWFNIVRDDEERYVVQVSRAGVVRIWDADSGQAQTVNFPDNPSAAAYATHTKDDDLELFQINDFVLLLNRSIVVQESSAFTGSRTPFAIVTVNSVGTYTEYKVQLDGTLYNYQTAHSSNVTIQIDDVTYGLASTINAGGTFTATVIANNLYIVKNDGGAFRINARGGMAGTALTAVYNIVNSPAELPRQFINNATIQIVGPEGGDDYWVIFKTDNGGTDGAGVWEETVAPNIKYALDQTTLPHAIIREADGTFTFRRLSKAFADAQTESVTVNGTVTSAVPTSVTKGIYAPGVSFWVSGGSGVNLRLRATAVDVNGLVTAVEVSRPGKNYVVSDVVTNEYGDTFTITGVASATSYADGVATQYYLDRIVGDDISNPYPTFTNKKISGISFFKNRLVFMSGENVICSTVGDYFNFFLSTVTTVVDSDPIDISCGSVKPIDLRYALLSNRGLALFADNAQYVLETRTDAFSAASAEINQVGSYDMSTKIAPVDLGPTIAFLDQGDRACSVFELLIGADTTTKPQTAELTRTIPSYLPSYVSSMKASTTASTLGIHSYREPSNLYLFRFYNVGNERQQASWFRWRLPGVIKTFYFENDEMHVVLIPDGQTEPVLVDVSLVNETTSAALTFEDTPLDVRLDCYTYNPTLVYDAVNEVTRVCFPAGFGTTTKTVDVLDLADGSVYSGLMSSDLGQPADQQYWLEVPGDQTTNRFAIGYRYTAEALLPAFYVVQNERKDTLNVPVIQRLTFDSYNSGPYQVTVNSLGRSLYTIQLPQVASDFSNLNTLPVLRNAQNTVQVMARGDQTQVSIQCPYPYPTAINGMTWTGLYNNRGIRTL